MSDNARNEALHRLEDLLQAVEDELLETAACLTEQDLGWFISEVSTLCRDAWDCRMDDGDELDQWEYWPLSRFSSERVDGDGD